MRRHAVRPTDALLDHLVGDAGGHPMAAELRAWLASSRRFRAFADAHRDKIRKKIRTAADREALGDVRAELHVAQLLLTDRRLELEFEVYGAATGGPDFTVHFAGERPFNCEVTRVRRSPADLRDGGPLLAKLRQLPPGAANVVIIAVNAANAAELDIGSAIADLRRRADAKEERIFVDRGLAGARAFHAGLLRLSAVVAWSEHARGDARAALWTNPAARIPLSSRAARAIVACLRGDG